MEIWLNVVKAGASALVILAITLLARHSPALGGTLAALPLVSILSLLWLSLDGQTPQQGVAFLSSVLWGYLPSALLVMTLIVCLKQRLPLPAALALGAMACMLSAWGIQLARGLRL
jgi:hypothetical protein